MEYNHWLPGKRDDQLHMAKTWGTVLAQKGQTWNVPLADITELASLTTEADSALTLTKSSERTQVITVRCREAFDALLFKMRYIKKRSFLQPPSRTRPGLPAPQPP